MEDDLKQLIIDTGAETRRHFDSVAEGLRQELGGLATELRQENVETRRQLAEVATSLREENAETRQRIDVVAAELRQENAETRHQLAKVATELRQEMQVTTSDLRRHFDVTAEDIRHQVQLVAEGVENVVTETVARLTSDLRNEFAESKAFMSFSYSDLDRRLRSLEGRVERLESSSDRTQ